ncbi:MAG: PAS domain-containing protein, partial [Coleofasciculus sp. S288]|nr:PAS domain-containing protein [Coleofasciculus sp. S288]
MTDPLKQSDESSEDNVQKLEEKVEKPQEITPKNRCSKQERKAYPLSEIALWKSQYFIQRILETTPNLVYIYDAIAKTTIYANCQFAEMLGYISEETVPIAVDFLPSLLHPDDVGKVSEQFKRFQDASDSQIFEIEYRIKHKNGEWRWFKSRETVFARTSEGLPDQILGIAEDITERKWVEEALRESERHLRTIFDHTFQFTGLLKPDGTLLEV